MFRKLASVHGNNRFVFVGFKNFSQRAGTANKYLFVLVVYLDAQKGQEIL